MVSKFEDIVVQFFFFFMFQIPFNAEFDSNSLLALISFKVASPDVLFSFILVHASKFDSKNVFR